MLLGCGRGNTDEEQKRSESKYFELFSIHDSPLTTHAFRACGFARGVGVAFLNRKVTLTPFLAERELVTSSYQSMLVACQLEKSIVVDREAGYMHPKIVFLDMEGTLLKKEIRLDDGLVAPSAWTLLAERLGPDCLRDEQATKERWRTRGYKNYLEWMKATVDIHRQYDLTEPVFREVIVSVEFTPGVDEAMEDLRRWGASTVLISGGFKALADRVQRRLRIDHALSGCEYFFDVESQRIEHFNLLPADERGKVDFMRLMCQEYEVDPHDCAFIGDGMNDVHLAREVGFSIAFNAQPELKAVATSVIDQRPGNEDFREVIRVLGDGFGRRQKRKAANLPSVDS